MSRSFTDWESELAHHGIPGMKHGVRRYQNEDGSLTPLGQQRYGVQGTGRSARKMSKDFNRLDKSYANANAYRVGKENKQKYYNLQSDLAAYRKKDKLAAKYKAKANAAQKEAQRHAKDMKNIESMQWRIMGNALGKGYSMKSKVVKRIGMTGKDKVFNILAGGPIGTPAWGLINRKKIISGQKVKFKKSKNNTLRVKIR